MSFFDSITESLNIGKGGFFRAVLLGDELLEIEGVKQIKSYSPEEIVVLLRKDGLKIKGNDLFVKKYCAGDLVVCGKILVLERI